MMAKTKKILLLIICVLCVASTACSESEDVDTSNGSEDEQGRISETIIENKDNPWYDTVGGEQTAVDKYGGIRSVMWVNIDQG
jgi:hypothetical protein